MDWVLVQRLNSRIYLTLQTVFLPCFLNYVVLLIETWWKGNVSVTMWTVSGTRKLASVLGKWYRAALPEVNLLLRSRPESIRPWSPFTAVEKHSHTPPGFYQGTRIPDVIWTFVVQNVNIKDICKPNATHRLLVCEFWISHILPLKNGVGFAWL